MSVQISDPGLHGRVVRCSLRCAPGWEHDACLPPGHATTPWFSQKKHGTTDFVSG